MAENKKEFNTKLYAIIVFLAIAVFLAIVSVVTFQSKYLAFHTDTVAANYVDTIVQKGDGYNAYKYTLVPKNMKYGDFIRENYMKEYINEDAEQSELTVSGDADSKTRYFDTMFVYYNELLQVYGYDDYDAIFSNYMKRAAEVRKEIYGDDYMTYDVLFEVFEMNVATYGDSLAGTLAIYDPADENEVLVEAKPGIYDEVYGEDYRLTSTTVDEVLLTEEEATTYTAAMNTDMLKTYKVSVDEISAVKKCTVNVTLDDGTVVVTQELYVVQIGRTWYIDNTTIDTSGLYNFYK